MKNKAFAYLTIIIAIFIIINLSRSTLGLLRKGEVLTSTQKRLSEASSENEKLKKELQEVQSKAYIEKQAREKLNLGKTGEIVIIMPSIPSSPLERIQEKTLPNWRKWLEIFI